MEKIKVGVIGTGFIGPVHIEAIRRQGAAEVIALSEVNAELARTKANMLGIEKSYGDYKELLADPEVQIVHICTPNHLHYEIAKEAIAAGKNVVCEKPLAMNTEEGKELVELADESGLICAMHLNCRAYPMVQQIRQMVKKGELGTIYAVNGSYQQDWLFKETDYSWRLEKQFSGESRAVADIGTHWFDTVETVTGLKTKKVCADFATFHKTRKKPLKPVETYSGKVLEPSDYEDVPIDTEDYATVLIKFDNGAHGSFTVNQVAAGRKNRMYFEIYGSKCAVAFDSEKPNHIWIGNRDGSNQIMMKDPSLMHAEAREYNSYPGGHTEGFADTSKHTVRRIYEAVTKGKKAGVDYPRFEDGYRELKLCSAIVESAGKEQWVDVE